MLSMPVFIWGILTGQIRIAAIIFFFAFVSDGVDGFIARRFDQQSDLGTLLDPIADKLLMVSSYITFTVAGLIPMWLGVIVISRDVIQVSGIVVIKLLNLRMIVDPSIIGKRTTFLQFIVILLSLAAALPTEMQWLLGLSDNSMEALSGVGPYFLYPVYLLTATGTIITVTEYLWREARGFEDGSLIIDDTA